MIRRMQEHKELKIGNDQWGAPTWSRTIADVTSQVLAQQNRLENDSGIYHLTSRGKTNWAAFAQSIFQHAPELKEIKDLVIKGIPTAEYPTPAQRPTNSALSTEKLRNTFGLALPEWETALQLCLAK